MRASSARMRGIQSFSCGQSTDIRVCLRPPVCCPRPAAETGSKLFSVNALSALPGKARRHPLSLDATVEGGRTTRRRHEPCRIQQFALPRADRFLWNLGAPVHCFVQPMRVVFRRSSLITTAATAWDWHHRDWIQAAAGRDMGSSDNEGAPLPNGYVA